MIDGDSHTGRQVFLLSTHSGLDVRLSQLGTFEVNTVGVARTVFRYRGALCSLHTGLLQL